MVLQIFNLSPSDIFKKYSNEYKIFRDVHSIGLYGLEIRNIDPKLANLIQSIVLKEKEICYKKYRNKNVDLLMAGSIYSFKELSRKIVSLGDEDSGYKIVNAIKNYEEYGSQSYSFGNQKLLFNKPLIMGILNVTPDSFSDGGKYFQLKDAVNHALEMIDSGADIIDVGGESTRPGSEPIPDDEEIRRTIPVIIEIKKLRPDCLISIDTTKSSVAKKALEHGASIVNDISGLTFDKSIASLIKKFDAGIILMHIKGKPLNMQDNPEYNDVIREVYEFLFEQSNFVLKKGIHKIIVDPGIGFGKSIEDNFEILRRLEDFKSLGFPIMIGLSKKSFIGNALNLDINQREVPSVILESISVLNSARIIRTHNVKSALQSTKLLQYFIQG